MPEQTHEHSGSRASALGARWLGAGLAAVLAATTLVLAAAGELTLYISPETVWFAVAAAIVTLIGVVWSCALPLGAEQDHGHDHSDAHRASGDGGHDHGFSDGNEGATGRTHADWHGASDRAAHAQDASDQAGHDAAHGLDARGAAGHAHAARRPTRRVVGAALAGAGGAIATAVAVGALVLPPAALSVDMAMQRAPVGNVLFAGVDNVALGANTDTSTFGVGGWASVFATGSRPEKYDGSTVTLTGFLTPDGSATNQVHLTRMVISHCVIDAQPASVPVEISGWKGQYTVGDWVQVKGTVHATADGKLAIVPAAVSKIPQPKDPYEH